MPRLLSGIIDRGVGLFSIEERLISFAIYIYVPILYTQFTSFCNGEDQAPDPPATVTHWQRHYPWNFVTPMALNSRGEQIYYRVESDQDRMWAWRMDRAVDHHMAVRERDLGNLSDSHARDLREVKDGGLLRWRQRRIEELESRIVAMHKTFHNGRGLGL